MHTLISGLTEREREGVGEREREREIIDHDLASMFKPHSAGVKTAFRAGKRIRVQTTFSDGAELVSSAYLGNVYISTPLHVLAKSPFFSDQAYINGFDSVKV